MDRGGKIHLNGKSLFTAVSYFDFSLTVKKNVIAQADDLQQCYVNGSLKNSFIF